MVDAQIFNSIVHGKRKFSSAYCIACPYLPVHAFLRNLAPGLGRFFPSARDSEYPVRSRR